MSWKLSGTERREIARLYAEGMTTTQLAQRFHVSQPHVSKVLKQEGVIARRPGRVGQTAVPHACERCGSVIPCRADESASNYAARRFCSKACRYAATALLTKARRDADPLTIGRRTLIAKTCPACGELLPAARFQRQSRGYYATACGRCVQSGWVAGMTPADRDALFRHRLAEVTRRNDEMRPNARRHGYLWTGPELELVERRELTATQVAAMLGRTPHAVRTQRKLLNRGHLVKTALAGTSSVAKS